MSEKKYSSIENDSELSPTSSSKSNFISVLNKKAFATLVLLVIFAGYLTWCFIDNFSKLGQLKKDNKKEILEVRLLKNEIKNITKDSEKIGFDYKSLKQRIKIYSKENLNLLKKVNAEEEKKSQLEKDISGRKINFKESETEYEKKKNYISLTISASENLKNRIEYLTNEKPK